MLGPARQAMGLAMSAMAAQKAHQLRSSQASKPAESEPDTETEIEAKRRKERERKAAYRAKKKAERNGK